MTDSSAPRKRVPRPADTNARIVQIVEAILFVGSEPLSAEAFARSFPEASVEEFRRAVHALQRRYRRENRPYLVRATPAGYTLELVERHAQELRSRSKTDRGVKLPRPVIEVLSLVAYRQPIGRPAIEEFLGEDVGAILRQLVRRELIALTPAAKQPPAKPSTEDTGEAPAPAPAYVTTTRFLDLFGLENLADLPATEDLQQL